MRWESKASWCSLEPAVLSQARFFFFYFIYLFESNPFICDLTCIDEIKLCWLFHKCTYQRCTSSPMPMRWAEGSLSIQCVCLHRCCSQIPKQTHTPHSLKGTHTNTLFHLCCCVYGLFTVIAWAFSPGSVWVCVSLGVYAFLFLFQSYNRACWAGK